MSTEIKNTLFRFVTMRAPELTDDKNKDTRFIFREDRLKGVFDTAVSGRANGVTKWEAMKTAAASFQPKSEGYFKEMNPNLYAFSVWIAKNKASWTKKTALPVTGVVKLNDADVTLLWNNLFYQVLTQKDFYAKEVIIQLLIANHTISNNKPNDPVLTKNLMHSKVVLPKTLFVEDQTTSGTPQMALRTLAEGETEIAPADENMRKQQEVALASLKIERYNNLQNELSRLEKTYRKEFKKEYDSQWNDYQDRIRPIMEDYAVRVEELKNNWCQIRNPELPYDPKDPCNAAPVVPEPKLPEFKLDFRDEINSDYLANNLSEEAFETLTDLFGGSLEPKGLQRGGAIAAASYSLSDFSSYDELGSAVGQAQGQAQNTLVNNTPDEDHTLISIGGVVIPVTDKAPDPFAFKVCNKSILGGKLNYDMEIEVPDSTWQVTGMTYRSTHYPNSMPDTTGTYYLMSRIGNIIYLKNLYPSGITYGNHSQTKSFLGEITFSNGYKKTFEVKDYNTLNCYLGRLIGDAPVVTNPGNPGTGNGPSNPQTTEAPFIPTGFGVKQLGIADYKKVEQSVQCYVEGEVAHIENVMARERREKSTRKLRKSENTTTKSTDSEKEQLTDTSSTSRFEMQNEVAKVIQQTKDFSAGTHFDANYGSFSLGGNVNFATHNSKEENTRQAVTQAKEITEKALDRVVTKIHEERIEKIVEEFEENNLHEFDNRKGDKHVVGVYRWVDKVYRNQIINFGKRLMFEFMIPQPAKLHTLALKEAETAKISVPTDPRTATSFNMSDYSKLDAATFKYWAGKYNAETDPMPEEFIYCGESFSVTHDGTSIGRHEGAAGGGKIEIPEGYATTEGYVTFNAGKDNDGQIYSGMAVSLGKASCVVSTNSGKLEKTDTLSVVGYQKTVPVSFTMSNFFHGNVNASVKCGLTLEGRQRWQQATFKAIIEAYENAVEQYNQKMAEEEAKGVAIKGSNPGFYRQIENMVLRKNCISYLIDQRPTAKNTYGKDMSNGQTSFSTYEVAMTKSLDDYAAFVKFMEQAFEWDIMSYNFYPYYWGKKADWPSLYQFDDTNDPLFRSFMQSGMARVVLTVRPGFEDAVRYYMQTGLIWNGGEVPVIEDQLFLSIVDELRVIEGEKEGKAWVTRLPTTLTILQADSIGLKVEKALPCNCEDVNEENFEHPEDVPCSSNFSVNEAQIGGGEVAGTARLYGTIKGNNAIIAKIELKNLDGSLRDITYCDKYGKWEISKIPAGKFELILDATNKFPEEEYLVVDGSKELAVSLEDGKGLEVNLELKTL